jgi:hypothetical protein
MPLEREDHVSHEYFFGICGECRKRGVNNRTETRRWADGIVSCESCARFRKGELDSDIPSLKLYLTQQGTEGLRPSIAMRQSNGITRPEVQNIPVVSNPVSIVSKEVLEEVQFLVDNVDEQLKTEILECIIEDKETLGKILSDSRFFSLRELRRHSKRLGKDENPPNLEEFEERLKKTLPKTRGKKKCQSKQNPGTSKSKTTSSSISMQERNQQETTNPSTEELAEQAKGRGMLDLSPVHVEGSKTNPGPEARLDLS